MSDTKRSFLRSSERDMTSGSIAAHLLLFSLPLLIGNVFQQLYNTVDSIIVGNYVGKEALAAIGGSTPIVNTFIMFFSGLCSGAGVVISNYYGAKNEEKLRRSVQTTFVLMLGLSAVLTVLGVALTGPMLKLMKTPPDVFDQAATYLRIYFGGLSGLLLYNTGAGILRAVGDSRRPLYILIFCTVTNTVLDYVFVKPLGWGIAGAAYATILSQFASAVLVILLLLRSKASYRLDLHDLRMSTGVLRSITTIGMPTALQSAITAFANVFVLSYINAFGSSHMAGWAAYIKIDSFAIQPGMSLSIAITTFVGQNLGASREDRVRLMPRYGLIMAGILLSLTITPIILYAPQLVALFNQDEEVIRLGTYFIRTISPLYAAFGINQVYRGILVGRGDTLVSMGIMLFSFVLFRQVYLLAVSHLGFGLRAISYGYPAGWIMCAALFLVYYYARGRHVNRMKT